MPRAALPPSAPSPLATTTEIQYATPAVRGHVCLGLVTLSVMTVTGRGIASERSQVLVAIGDEAYAIGHLEDAARAYGDAIRNDANDAAAHYGFGLTAMRRARWDAARQAFERALGVRPDFFSARRALAYTMLELGRIAADAGDDERAAARFERAATLVPELEGLAGTLAAATHLRLGDDESARRWLDRVSRSSDARAARRARRGLEDLRRSRVAGRWRLGAAAAMRYDSNVALEPDRGALRLEGDPGDAEAMARVAVGHRWLDRGAWVGTADASVEQTLHPVLDDFDWRLQHAEIGLGWGRRAWFVALLALGDQWDLADDPYLRAVEVGPVLAWYGARTAVRGDVFATRLDYLEAPFEDSRDGWRRGLRIGFERELAPHEVVEAAYEYRFEDPDSLRGDDFEYGEHRFRLAASRAIPGWRSEVDVTYECAYADFTRPNSAAEFRRTRVDVGHFVGVAAWRRLGEVFRIGLEAEAELNRSNVEVFEYQRLMGGVRVEMSF